MYTVYKGSTQKHDFYILCKSGMRTAKHTCRCHKNENKNNKYYIDLELKNLL